ncbi:hypothetical protein [Guggenheimella bovis]
MAKNTAILKGLIWILIPLLILLALVFYVIYRAFDVPRVEGEAYKEFISSLEEKYETTIRSDLQRDGLLIIKIEGEGILDEASQNGLIDALREKLEEEKPSFVTSHKSLKDKSWINWQLLFKDTSTGEIYASQDFSKGE